jgi:hypothetical protein
MPFKSLAQEGYMHAHPEILGKKGLSEWDSATKGKHLPQHAGGHMAKKHEFSHSTVHHHKDGSHTMHHHHESDPKKDVEHAVADHQGMMDSMQQNLGPQAAGEGGGEEAMEAGAAGGAPGAAV